ncbi:MAG: bile acid:sodium symporter family protein [Leptospiraceae bacterium]|nr:bile acid:sodium symporter family protein [Leptospiraceae bacterium]
MESIDQIALNFNPASLVLLNVVLGLVMFGVALDLRWSAFESILKNPRGPIIGLAAQFLILPAVTFLLVEVWEVWPSIALGMMLVAACPGGNISNIMTYLAGGNTAMSVSMTAVSTAVAVFMTPFNITFWASLYAPTASLLRDIALSPWMLFGNVLLVLGLPLVLGMSIAHRFPALAWRLKTPFKYISVTFFILFVLGALSANWQTFLSHVSLVAGLVFVHNLLALLSGYSAGKLLGLPDKDRRAVTIETGIQNSGLGLTLIFTFFIDPQTGLPLGGMALIAAWWGVWHIISGLSLAFAWNLYDRYHPAVSE